MPKQSYPRTKKGNNALIFGHSLLHSYWYKCLAGKCPKNWSHVRIRFEHARHVKIMLARGFKHNSPLLKKRMSVRKVKKILKKHFDYTSWEYKGKKYMGMEIPVIDPAGQEQPRGLVIAPESLRDAFPINRYDEEIDYPDIDNYIFEYHPDAMIKKGDVDAVLKNLYDDIEWKFDPEFIY